MEHTVCEAFLVTRVCYHILAYANGFPQNMRWGKGFTYNPLTEFSVLDYKWNYLDLHFPIAHLSPSFHGYGLTVPCDSWTFVFLTEKKKVGPLSSMPPPWLLRMSSSLGCRIYMPCFRSFLIKFIFSSKFKLTGWDGGNSIVTIILTSLRNYWL